MKNWIWDLTPSFPKEEKFRLADQIIRSSRSVGANISEGHRRYHYQENIQFCRVARGSLDETLNHLIDALDCGYVLEEKFQVLKLQQETARKILNGYIAYLKKQEDLGK